MLVDVFFTPMRPVCINHNRTGKHGIWDWCPEAYKLKIRASHCQDCSNKLSRYRFRVCLPPSLTGCQASSRWAHTLTSPFPVDTDGFAYGIVCACPSIVMLSLDCIFCRQNKAKIRNLLYYAKRIITFSCSMLKVDLLLHLKPDCTDPDRKDSYHCDMQVSS